MGWSTDRVNLLQELNALGLSASVIAERLGFTSRNAVIGKLHRMGLSMAKAKGPAHHNHRQIGPRGRTGPVPNVPPSQREPAPNPPSTPIEPLRAPPIDSPGVTLHEAGHGQCRYPISDEPFLFCGLRTSGVARSFCAQHHRIAYYIRPFNQQGPRD
jgi:GcrA cell cycle regulator